jgi:hypothetical protein
MEVRTMKILVIQLNSDGRPCAWGLVQTHNEAKAIALRQWNKHECYPNETKGVQEIHRIEENEQS